MSPIVPPQPLKGLKGASSAYDVQHYIVCRAACYFYREYHPVKASLEKTTSVSSGLSDVDVEYKCTRILFSKGCVVSKGCVLERLATEGFAHLKAAAFVL